MLAHGAPPLTGSGLGPGPDLGPEEGTTHAAGVTAEVGGGGELCSCHCGDLGSELDQSGSDQIQVSNES